MRRELMVEGIVQGVGFRPFVYGLATELGLGGFVRNETAGVRIEVEGEPAAIDRFVEALGQKPPPLARVERISGSPRDPLGELGFRIEASERTSGDIQLSPDVAPCADCVRELFDPADRRYGYAFGNCTSCGPRLTIIEGAPYDRARTTMAAFAMCEACRREYGDPRDRRFHAQPNACPACGPRLSFGDSADPIGDAARALRAGAIVAIKGLGGYHLACDATDPAAVARLRERKHRDEKPFAVMVADLGAARALCALTEEEERVLAGPERPILLARRAGGGAGGVCEGVAPRSRMLGLMLPSTPLHHLLARAVGGLPLVMTSGNRSDEPIAHDDTDARERLGDIADAFLAHDRRIHTRCDDSVVRVIDGAPVPLRRSRGHAPRTLALPVGCARPVLALGGHQKAAFAFGAGQRALLGHHLGDLDERRAYDGYAGAIAHYERVFELSPELLVHDLHPDYASTRYARERGLLCLAVQHHHAHVASCLAEHGLAGPVIGVAFDGGGLGTDGAVWGGEILVADLRGFERACHLRCVALPGGERAIREPWRMALAHLVAAGAEELDEPLIEPLIEPLLGHIPAGARRTVRAMIDAGVNAPLTSSAGRLFDAVACLAGVRDTSAFEGQAAMELEGLAEAEGTEAEAEAYAFAAGDGFLDPGPVVLAVARDRLAGVAPARIAARFHAALAAAIAEACAHVRDRTGIEQVALTGGVFQNALLTRLSSRRLVARGLRVLRHREVPPNDGGLALGQLAIAAAAAAGGPA